LRNLATLLDILSSVGHSHSVADGLAEFARKTLDIVGLDGCTIFEWSRIEDTLVVLVSARSPLAAGAQPGMDADGAFPVADHPAVARLLQRRTYQIVARRDSAASAEEKAWPAAWGWDCVLMLPLLYQGRVTGLMQLGVEDSLRRPFSEDDLVLSQVLANQVAVALENARFYREIEDRRWRTELFHAIGEALTSETEYHRILDRVAEFVHRLVDAQLVVAAVPEAEELVPVALAGRAASLAGAANPLSILLDRPMLHLVVQAKQPLVIPDLHSGSAGEARRAIADTLGVRSLVAVPLVAGERTLAVLAACACQPAAFTPEDVVLLAGVASRAAVSIQNVELRAKLEAQHQVLRLVSLRMVNAQEEERRHISRELHDELGQALTALKINLDLARRALPGDASGQLRDSLAEASSLAVSVLERARNLSLKFHPAILDDLGLVAALRWEVDRYERRIGQTVDFEADLHGATLGPELEIIIYRIVTEALTNIARHARADHIRVSLRLEDRQVIVGIEDDGVGFDAAAWFDSPAERRSLGLIGMRERAGLLGGELEVISAPGCGTQVRALFPFGADRPTLGEGD
jgi:signal transduction histidine kinase